MHLHCIDCKGSGVNPHDDANECETCGGDGHASCERRACKSHAVVFNDDGEALCEDCAFEEAC